MGGGGSINRRHLCWGEDLGLTCLFDGREGYSA